MAWWESILHGLWLFLPAYVANMSPVFAAKLVPRWNAPMDGGRVGNDGNRVLGPGKTWRGLAGGALAGGLIAIAMAALAPQWGLVAGWDFGHTTYAAGAPIGSSAGDAAWQVACPDCAGEDVGMTRVFLFGSVLGAMALIGDAVKSYFKRRRGKDRGAPWVPFDQLDFVVSGLVGMMLAAPLLPNGWIKQALLGDLWVPAAIVVLTPALHWFVNWIGYRMKLKDVPW